MRSANIAPPQPLGVRAVVNDACRRGLYMIACCYLFREACFLMEPRAKTISGQFWSARPEGGVSVVAARRLRRESECVNALGEHLTSGIVSVGLNLLHELIRVNGRVCYTSFLPFLFQRGRFLPCHIKERQSVHPFMRAKLMTASGLRSLCAKLSC